ncbi:MAG: Uma2 family endonuclease, partial [Spirochaetota bacterium]
MGVPILEKESVRDLACPISKESYYELGRLGLIPEKTELLQGIVIHKMPKNPKHSEVLKRIFEFLYEQLKAEYDIRKEEPISFEASEPEPDLSIVEKKQGKGYSQEHPSVAFLLVEVANTSLALDRSKAEIYALGGIPEYWIINLVEDTIEVYQNPQDGSYQEK